MKILHIMDSVNDARGGPIEGLVQADVVGRALGHTRTIVSLDLPSDPWVARCPIETAAMGCPPVKAWTKHVPLLRYGFTPHLVPWLQDHVTDFDRVVVNGLWNFSTLAARLVLPYRPIPYFVFTHGMLDPWFRRAHPLKHWGKQASWWTVEGPLLHRAAAVLFTSEAERQTAAGAFWPYRIDGRIAGYGTGDAPARAADHRIALEASVPALNRRPYLLFLGRLHPKKGCDLLLKAFAAQRAARDDLQLVMAGPDNDGWMRHLRAMAVDLGIDRHVHWPGMLRGAAKWGALFGCDAFVLPSHGENFGIAVVEAMACRKPVLITHKVNIAADVVTASAGLAEPDTETGVTSLLARFSALSATARTAMAERARACFLDKFHIDRVAQRTLSILESPEHFA